MKPVFLDTVGLLAVLDSDDQWHAAALPVYDAIIRAGRPTFTTPLVLYECGNALSRTEWRPDLDELRQLLVQAGQLIEPTAPELEASWQEYRRLSPGAAGIVDLVSFVVMRRLGITDVFTNDRHFAAAGFTVLF
jgi:predicted nucleic acid-binding protein